MKSPRKVESASLFLIASINIVPPSGLAFLASENWIHCFLLRSKYSFSILVYEYYIHQNAKKTKKAINTY